MRSQSQHQDCGISSGATRAKARHGWLLKCGLALACLAGGGYLGHAQTFGTATWDHSPSPGVTGYRIYRSLIVPGIYSKVWSVPYTNVASVPIKAGVTNWFVASAIGQGGLESDITDPVPVLGPPPTAKSNVVAISVVVFQSTNVTGPYTTLTNFILLRSTNSAGFFKGKLVVQPQ